MATIEASVRKSEGLSSKEAKRLEKMFDEIAKANPSMPPNIYQAKATIVVDSSHGGQHIPGDVLGDKAIAELKKLADKFSEATGGSAEEKAAGEQIFSIIGDYLDVHKVNELYSVEVLSGGWMANLSMPGHMDQTEASRYDTLKEAIEDLHRMYGEG